MPSRTSKVVRGLGSFGFACILLIFLNLLTWLGTLEQRYNGLLDTQKKYFDSLLLVHWFTLPLPEWLGGNEHELALPIPLPGVYLLLALLLVNLLVGGIVRLRKSWSRLGILIAHLGIVLMLAAGFVSYRWKLEGRLSLYPGDSSAEFESFTDSELTVREAVPSGTVAEYAIPMRRVLERTADGSATFRSTALPFDLTVTRAFSDCAALPKGPMFNLDPRIDSELVDGYFLRKGHSAEKGGEWLERDNPTAEARMPGAVVELRDRESGATSKALLWDLPLMPGKPHRPLTYSAGGKDWLIELRRTRWQLPFTVRLEKFNFEQHPRTGMAKLYSSDVTKIENGVEQPIKIAMNEPLRRAGYTLYQASFGPNGAQPGDRMYTQLEVVHNPSDQWPKYSCFVIAIGLLYHFVYKLYRYVKSENRRTPPAQIVQPLPAPASAAAPRPRPLSSARRES